MVSQGNGREYRSLGLSEGLRRDCEGWEWWFVGQRRGFGSLLRWPSSTSKWSRCERRGYGRCSVMIRRRFERVLGRNEAWGASEGICTDLHRFCGNSLPGLSGNTWQSEVSRREVCGSRCFVPLRGHVIQIAVKLSRCSSGPWPFEEPRQSDFWAKNRNQNLK